MSFVITAMTDGICRLCNAIADLQLSHIIPAFIYRWLRDSSGNGHIRSSATPNRRIQDGPKEHWLCRECESRFNRVETVFATELFHPYLVASEQRFSYGPWLLQFCASVSWRVLEYYFSRSEGPDWEDAALAKVKKADAAWRAFILGKAPHPGRYRQHLLPLDEVKSATGNLPPNMNRYLMRAIDIDLCRGGETIFVYSKLGRFIILGFISEPYPNRWVGTKINANRGVVEPRKYTLPSPFGDFLMDKANSVTTAMSALSKIQREKIDTAFRRNIDKIVGSDFFKAMQADVNMFGQDAFTTGSSEEDGKR